MPAWHSISARLQNVLLCTFLEIDQKTRVIPRVSYSPVSQSPLTGDSIPGGSGFEQSVGLFIGSFPTQVACPLNSESVSDS
jgi:hypothetical protein